MFKRLLTFLLAVVMLLSMAFFASAEEQQTIRVVWWGSQTRHDLTTQMVNKFMEKYPNIKVEVEFTDWGGYWNKLATQAAGGMMPDVMQFDYNYVKMYVQNGLLADMSEYVSSGKIDLSNVAESMYSGGMVDGKVYGVPTGLNFAVTVYRKDIADQAGVELPTDMTWEAWVDASKKVYAATGRKDSNIVDGDEFNTVRMDARNMGLDFFNEDGTALGFDDPKYLVDMWQRIQNAMVEGYGLDVSEKTQTSGYDRFISDTWIGTCNSNELSAYETESNCELTLATIPSIDGATQAPTYFKPAMLWSVAENSTAKDAAATFINFFVNDTDCYDIVGTDRGMPVSSKIREYLAPNLDATSQKVADMMDYLSQEGKTSAIFPPDPASAQEITQLLEQYSEQVQYNLVDDLNAHALAFMEEANALLANAAAAE